LSQPFKGQTRTTDAIIPDELVRLSQVSAGGLTFAKVVKPIDQSIANQTTPQDDNHLKFTPVINEEFFIMLFIYFNAPTTPDIKTVMSIPTGATMEDMFGNGLFRNTTTSQSLTDATIAKINISSAGINKTWASYYKLAMGATIGDCVFQWAQNISDAAPTIVLKGSMILVWEE